MSDTTSRRDLLRRGIALPAATAAAALLHESAPAAENSAAPRAAQPLAQDYTVIHQRTNPKTYVEGCGIIVLEDGAILAVVPVVPRGGVPKKGPTAIHFIRSDDGGKTWTPQSTLPFYSAVPFLHAGRLYCFLFTMGPRVRNDDLFLAASDDGGRTWTDPVMIFQGHFWTCQTNMVRRDNNLYWAVDDLRQANHSPVRSPRVIAGDLTADLLDPASWRMSNYVPFPKIPKQLQFPDYDAKKLGIWDMPDHWLEADVVEVGGQLRVLATVKSQSQMTANLCGACDLEDDGEQLQMSFRQFYPMVGGQLKFAIVRDEPSRLFWATANLTVDSQETHDWFQSARAAGNYSGTGGNDRRLLMLMYSVDALNWFQAGCIAQAAHLRQSFMYGTPVVQGDDLLVISRSSINASDQHDADHATFHRVPNFRALALNLFPAE